MIVIEPPLREAIDKHKINDLIDIEAKLYLINNYIEQRMKPNSYIPVNKLITIHEEISFIIIQYDSTEFLILFDNEYFTISSPKRIILFIEDENTKERRFVYNDNYFKKILKEKKIKLFECSGTNTSNNSLLSEYDENELSNYFYNEAITEIKKIETNFSTIISEFEIKNKFPIYIKDLSLNMTYYNNNTIENKIIYTNDLNEFKNKKIVYFLNDNFSNILFFFGIKGCGKTIKLLYSSLALHLDRDYKIPRLYINYKLMKKKGEKRKLIFKKEMFYLFHKCNDLEDFLKRGIHKCINNNDNIIQFLKNFVIEVLKTNYLNNKKLLLIIDNYDEEEEDNSIEEFIFFIKNQTNKIKLILSGNGLLIKNKQKLYIKDNTILGESYLECFFYNYKINKIINFNSIPHYIYSLPEYYFRFISQKLDYKNINSFTKELINEENDVCKKLPFYGKYFSIIHEKKILSIKQFEANYNILPIEYLRITKNKNNLSFEIYNEVFKNALKESINSEVQLESIQNLIASTNCARTELGIYEEKLLTLLLKENKIFLNNLIFTENNKLEVEELYDFIISKYDQYTGNLDDNKPIIITQKNYIGKCYDILILYPTGNGDYDCIFIQIGLNKLKTEIKKLVEDIAKNSNKYKIGIKKYINKKINEIFLAFIFDKDTQENINEYANCAADYCDRKNIKYLLFSLEDYNFYERENDKYQITQYFKYKLSNKNNLGKKRKKLMLSPFDDLKYILDDAELNLLIEEKPGIKNINKILKKKVENIDFRQIAYQNVYIIIDEKEEINGFIIGKNYKIIKNGFFENGNKTLLKNNNFILLELFLD